MRFWPPYLCAIKFTFLICEHSRLSPVVIFFSLFLLLHFWACAQVWNAAAAAAATVAAVAVAAVAAVAVAAAVDGRKDAPPRPESYVLAWQWRPSMLAQDKMSAREKSSVKILFPSPDQKIFPNYLCAFHTCEAFSIFWLDFLHFSFILSLFLLRSWKHYRVASFLNFRRTSFHFWPKNKHRANIDFKTIRIYLGIDFHFDPALLSNSNERQTKLYGASCIIFSTVCQTDWKLSVFQLIFHPDI